MLNVIWVVLFEIMDKTMVGIDRWRFFPVLIVSLLMIICEEQFFSALLKLLWVD